MATPTSFEVGNCVEVFGLESEGGKALNGKKGIITNEIGFKGRLEVRLGPEKKVSLKPDNLRSSELTVQERLVLLGLPTASGTSDSNGQANAFNSGDQVEVFGLTSEEGKLLNGKQGSVVKYLDNKSRFEVRFADSKVANVKADNLRLCGSDHVSAKDPASAATESRDRSRSRSRNGDRKPDESSVGEAKTMATEPQATENAPFRPGQCVEVFGLESAGGSALNGQTGIVSQCLASGRVEVRFSEKVVSLKPECLRKITFDFKVPEGTETAAPAPGNSDAAETPAA